MNQPTFAQRIVLLHRALARIPHAFGGALALAYYAEPRATVDIDINVFVPPARFKRVATAMGTLGAAVDDPAVAELVARDGQARVMWDATPIDMFFAYDPFHHAAAEALRRVPFADTVIPVLSAAHLVVCKAIFNRPKDWVDIDAMIEGGTAIDAAEVARWVGRIAGDTDPRYTRIVNALAQRSG